MNDTTQDVLDPPRSKLRALAEKLEQCVAELDATSANGGAVMRAWRELSVALALGEEPALRACPGCTRRIPIEATRCRYCMAGSAAVRAAPTP